MSMPSAALHSNSDPELLEGGVTSGQRGTRASEVAEEMVEAESSLRLGGSASPAVQSIAPAASMATDRAIDGGGTNSPGADHCGGADAAGASCRDSREPSGLASCDRVCVGRLGSGPPNGGRGPICEAELPSRRKCCSSSRPGRAVRGRSTGGWGSVSPCRGGSLDSPSGRRQAECKERRTPACRSGRSARRRAARSAALRVRTWSRRRLAPRWWAGVPGAP